MLQTKQKGFTLLELLVVITLLALLSVGALVAYDGVGDNAGATAAANNLTVTDRTIRQYIAVTGNFPNQWDVLSDQSNVGLAFDGIDFAEADDRDANERLVAHTTRSAFGAWNIAGAEQGVISAVTEALINYGIDELQVQTVTDGTLPAGVPPSASFNEGTNPDASEVDVDEVGEDLITLSVFPQGGTCTAGGQSLGTNFAGDTLSVVDQNNRLNAINDFYERRVCNLILALGFGHDAAQSMQNSAVQMTAAPTFSSRAINPANTYGRFVGLFYLGSQAAQAGTQATIGGDITAGDIVAKPRLIAILTPEGQDIDEALAAATATNSN